MRLVDEHPRLDTRVVVHELARLVEIGVEDADAADLALVGNRTDDREQPVGPQREIAPPVLPDDLVGAVAPVVGASLQDHQAVRDRKSTRLNSSHPSISYAVFCLKKKKKTKHSYRHVVKSQLEDP